MRDETNRSAGRSWGPEQVQSLTEAEKQGQSEPHCKALFDLSPQPIAVTELETGRLLEVNRKFCELSGYEAHEVIGRPTWEIGIIAREDRAQFAEVLARVGEVRGLPMRFFNRYGKAFETMVFARIIEIGAEPVVTTVVLDLTEQKQLETQLAHAHKMEALGTLAGGVAHDFNNILMIVGGLASLGRQEAGQSRAVADLLEGIEAQVRSAAALTRQLLTFAGSGTCDMAPTDLGQLVTRTTGMFARTHKGIAVEVTCAPDAWTAAVDGPRIEQMLLNLYVNAAHAMAGGGWLRVSLRNAVLDEPTARARGVEPGRYVELTVSDTGTGMDEATRVRVFEPFFTTKEIGRGTGLGLASVYGIVKNHGGTIDVWSEPGVGTRFDIHLPVSRSAAALDAATPERLHKGRGVVLIVDDEEVVGRVTEAMVRELGYNALVARSGPEAVALFRQRGDEIDLVLLDMVMPTMSGAQVFEELNKIRPGVAVLLVSGHAAPAEMSDVLGRGCRGLLQKPFGLQELSARLASMLAEQQRS